jgi:putative SOS response-associated peptidase YedK
MCGRFAQVVKHNQLKKLIDELNIRNNEEQIEINYNVAPTQAIAAVMYKREERFLTFFRWGLIPSWSKEPSTQYSMINVRAETILEKKTFKNALLRRRCIIPVSGFYEWRKPDKQPFYIHAKAGSVGFQSCAKDGSAALESSSTEYDLLYFAGITEYWTGADGSFIQSAAIITTDANDTMKPIHDRMPVILPPDTWESWLTDSFQDPKSLQSFLVPCANDILSAYPVSRLVNTVNFNSEDCYKPLATELSS